MEPAARETFWNIPHWAEIAQYVLGGLTVVVFLAGLYWRVWRWRRGTAEKCTEPLRNRIKNLVAYGLFQRRLSSDTFSTVMHLSIFWGMVVLAIGTAVATIDWDVTKLFFSFQFLRGPVYYLFELAMDLFGLALLAGLALALYRRYLVRPNALRMTSCARDSRSSAWLLGVLLLIAVTGFVAEGLRIEAGYRAAAKAQTGAELTSVEQASVRNLPASAWAPVGIAFSKLAGPLSEDALRATYRAVWWVHALAAFAFIATIPLTKAFHLVSSPASIFFANPSTPDRLASASPSGARALTDFTWRQLLQVDACTWCGKCLDACPMGETGMPHPTCGVVQRLQTALDDATWWGQSRARRAAALARSIVAPDDAAAACPPGASIACAPDSGVIAAAELWSCCMCRACEARCPVLVEHPRFIVDLRRNLVEQGRVDEGLQDALMKLTRYGNSFGQSARKRTEWAKPLGFPVKDAAKEEVEYLWFVGDYASFDPRAREVAQTIARLFQRAGVDFGLLMDKEQNAGNDVRRIGEEGLFGMLRDKNLKALGAAKFRKILTTDPHTLNALKNEYAAEGASADGGNGNGGNGHGANGGHSAGGKVVLHYTELLDELLQSGALKVTRPLGRVVTYHDPCYLGRFNGIYEPPRRVLAALGVRLVEMPRHGRDSFCCGAGGGKIWMKDAPGAQERPAEHRVKEALAVPGVECLVVACPKDLVMFQDAVKTVGAEPRIRVVDIGELACEATEIVETQKVAAT